MVNTFNQKNPANVLVLFLYALALKLPQLLHPKAPVIRPDDGFLMHWLTNWLKIYDGGSNLLFSVLAFFLVLLQALYLNKIVNDSRFFPKSGYLVGMSLILITSLFPDWSLFSAGLIANTLILFALTRLLSLYHSNNPRAVIFNAGLLMGVTCFFFFPAIAFVVMLLFALLIMRPFRLSEWIIAFMGVVTPYYFLLVIVYLSGSKDFGAYFTAIDFNLPYFVATPYAIAGIGLLAIPFLLGWYYVQYNKGKMLIQVRKGWSLMLFYVIVACFIPFINNVVDFSHWIVCAIPIALFHAAAYGFSSKRFLPLIIHWLCFALAVYVGWIL